MGLKSSSASDSNTPVGVIGTGSFGQVVAKLLAEKSPVWLYARSEESAQRVRDNGLPANVQVTTDPAVVAKACEVIFPMVPSANFRDMIRQFAPYLHPYHTLIHGTKGLELASGQDLQSDAPLTRAQICTMSEVIQQETVVVRIGCLAGPNLASELADDKPAATVIASRFDEVIASGQKLLRSDRFQVYGNSDLIGVEICGVLKNIIAIAAGMVHELGLGENARALLISRGLVEMIYLGQAFGGNLKAFIGLAGVGDLVATSNSITSRNFTVGRLLVQKKSLEEVKAQMEETAEGINTVLLAKKFAETAKIRVPITEVLHRVLYQELSAEEATTQLMKFPSIADVDFL
ncbi:MAG TPA: glycerol 3-phosphate dehydrogenase [Cytophagales bacterium]|nr:glycerol 3-phosphate dehydrogenase [Cytophagales bacterium]HAP63330.1 glycerol 3-phosphate dehydrogenase [Cytophagales bacterium]